MAKTILKPEYMKKILTLRKGRFIKASNFKKRYSK